MRPKRRPAASEVTTRTDSPQAGRTLLRRWIQTGYCRTLRRDPARRPAVCWTTGAPSPRLVGKDGPTGLPVNGGLWRKSKPLRRDPARRPAVCWTTGAPSPRLVGKDGPTGLPAVASPAPVATAGCVLGFNGHERAAGSGEPAGLWTHVDVTLTRSTVASPAPVATAGCVLGFNGHERAAGSGEPAGLWTPASWGSNPFGWNRLATRR